MDIKGFTFGWMSKRGMLKTESAKVSLKKLIEETSTKHVIIPILAVQTGTNTFDVDYKSNNTFSREEYIEFSNYAKSLGVEVIVKAMVNCLDGSWRGLINFFNVDIPCEPKWSEWFNEYGLFVDYCAQIAEEIESPLFCVGCEMVASNHRSEQWRKVIKSARNYYSGPVTYNCDKYQESNIDWWDEVDIISSSGYYPIDKIEENYSRINDVVIKFNKPFLFMECGCPSRAGSQYEPNNWSLIGEPNPEVQAEWTKELILRGDHIWMNGFVWWDWPITLYNYDQAIDNDGYCPYGKPAASIIQSYYGRESEI